MDHKLPHWILDKIPEYKKAEYVSQVFDDSTHQLWRLHGSNVDNKNHFLKISSNTKSPFWEIMNDLFEYDLNAEINNFSDTYETIDKVCSLEIPSLINAETVSNTKAYILTEEINGAALNTGFTNETVIQLANYLAELHSHSSSSWGALNHPKFTPKEWSIRLEETLKKVVKRWGDVFSDSDKYLTQAKEACKLLNVKEFIPMILDLRSDQFLQRDKKIKVLLDLDAFVFAPCELDFVILEYLLTFDQIEMFTQVYSKKHDIPDIQFERPAYRLLLFYMRILGENDLNKWMNKEIIFKKVPAEE